MLFRSEVEGPGLGHLLEMEAGLHRRRRGGDVHRLLVEVVPRRAGVVSGKTQDARRTTGTFVEELRARVVVELADRATTRHFRGIDRETLALLAGALTAAARVESSPARAYHFDGVAVRDLRTGAQVVAAKDLKHGALEPLRAAWESRG